MTNIVCLSATISASLICNAFALIFIFRKNDERNLKDKIIGFLCCINGCQTIGYAVELHAAINGRATQVHIFWRELLLYFGRTIAVSEYSLKFPWKRYVGIFENLESKNKTWLFTDRALKQWFSRSIVCQRGRWTRSIIHNITRNEENSIFTVNIGLLLKCPKWTFILKPRPIGWPWHERIFPPGCKKSLQQNKSAHFSL